jgi:hypothetical protein
MAPKTASSMSLTPVGDGPRTWASKPSLPFFSLRIESIVDALSACILEE